MSADTDFLFRGSIEEQDLQIAELIEREAERQTRKLIMIPSESYAPLAVRQALGSVFQNIYAEGYPSTRAVRDPEELLLDDAHQLAYYRRYADRRFYKGVEFADSLEALAGRRAARCFATDGVPEGAIRANIQALSGAAANLAVYDCLLEEGDTLMGLDLYQGGHLTHGSEFNISGKRYRVVSYGVSPKTGRLDYDQIRELALAHRPRLIIAGYTSYSWAPDWMRFQEIADQAGAFLMADIAHTAGMVIGGVYPNPVGIADVTVFTTHKTLGGPRGAVILTTDDDLADRIDLAVFPGAQGGPHVNKFAALCVAFNLARTEQFRKLQQRTVENARALAAGFKEQGLTVAYGGTDTHIVLVDVSAVESPTRRELGFPLRGEMAARILDLAGIVVNKNTIPGDTQTALASGIRFGTPWVSQRGLGTKDMGDIAAVVRKVLAGIQPFAYQGLSGELPRGKIELDLLEEAKKEVDRIVGRAGTDRETNGSGYPYFFNRGEEKEGETLLEVSGCRAAAFLQEISTSNLAELEPARALRTFLLDREGKLIDEVALARLETDRHGRDRFLLRTGPGRGEEVKAWLRGLADGYLLFDDEDLFRKVQGPAVVRETEHNEPGLFSSLEKAVARPGTSARELYRDNPERFDLTKPYFVGRSHLDELAARAGLDGRGEWSWTEPEQELKKTGLFETHREMGARMVPFAGWSMPVWYTSVSEEHLAVRRAAGLFDVSHMGCFEFTGPKAMSFLDTVLSNYVHWLEDGQSCYSYLLDPYGRVIDDLMVYRLRVDRYLMVVNAVNEDKDWDWLKAVNESRVIIDRRRPWVRVAAPAELHNLKDPAEGERQKRDMALQGPKSLAILKDCLPDRASKDALDRLRRTDLMELDFDDGAGGRIPAVVARTGYTGEDIGYEIFVHPDQQVRFWKLLLEKGEPHGIKPCGLAARDSTRTEAGLPLYGHELAGPLDVTPAEAGFAAYLKYHKPFFVGRDMLLPRDLKRERELVRFRLDQKGIRRPNTGDPVANSKGQVIGRVTSCSIDSEGYLLGLAIVDRRYTVEGTHLSIFVLPPKPKPEKQKEALEPGDRVLLPAQATVLSRFPMRKEGGPLPGSE